MEKDWHAISWQEVIKKLNSDSENGLTEKEAKFRLEKFGKNRLPEEKPFSRLRIFFEQFKSPLIYILIVAGIVTLILKEYTDSIVIFGAVILNTIVGFLQESKASQALRELKKVVKIEAKVIREGNPKIIDSQDLVPGDIFEIRAGDKVPADGRIIKAENLKINEMALTGEWLPAKKHSEILPKEVPLADRDNMVYMGTIVEDGLAKIICTETGLKTEMGKVALMIRETREEKTPLQRKLARFAKLIGIIILIISIFIFIEGMLVSPEPDLMKRFEEIFTTSVALAVAAIPEGLPVAMTVILAIGMQRILKRKGLVRKLLAAETLGSTSVIATDKTATLTEGKMRVSEILTGKEIFENQKGDHSLILKIATLLSEAFVENPKEKKEKWILRGDPTSRALLLAGLEAGFSKKELERKMPEIDKIPFNPINKFVAGLYKLNENQKILYLCGAPEKILKLSNFLKIDEKEENLTEEKLKVLNSRLEKLTSEGLRVVAAAYKIYDGKILKYEKLEDLCDQLTFVGFLALKDPLRKDVKEAIEICKRAGMKPIIVTGDHKLTAKAIAKEIGLKTKEENIIEGKDLDKISDEEFEKKLDKIEVYARVEPRHKMRIISAWQKRGKVIAMTGDGINDAPALKKADIGVAVGSGTDVAKEVADLVLLPDSFNIIVAAVEEGRAIVDNIRKVITYLLTSSFAEIILIGSSLALGQPLPVLATQILWINLIEDGPLSISLAFEPKEKGLMERKPEFRKIPLLTKEMKIIIFIIGIILNILLVSLYLGLRRFTDFDIHYIRTIIFIGLAIDSIFFIFACKSLRQNVWQINPFSNKFLIFAWISAIILLIAAVYLPVFQILLKTRPLKFFDWLLLFGLGIISLGLIEATKWYFISKRKKHGKISNS